MPYSLTQSSPNLIWQTVSHHETRALIRSTPITTGSCLPAKAGGILECEDLLEARSNVVPGSGRWPL